MYLNKYSIIHMCVWTKVFYWEDISIIMGMVILKWPDISSGGKHIVQLRVGSDSSFISHGAHMCKWFWYFKCLVRLQWQRGQTAVRRRNREKRKRKRQQRCMQVYRIFAISSLPSNKCWCILVRLMCLIWVDAHFYIFEAFRSCSTP